MAIQSELKDTPKRQLTLFDCVCIIMGIVIGAGIYETTPLIAQNSSGTLSLVGLWILGGVISIIGALCYAELATTYPKEGGDYVYLSKAYGRKTGFLFAWSVFWLIRPANIGALAYIFANYAVKIAPLGLGHYDFMTYASASVILLTLVNVFGVSSGKWTQNILTVAKVFGLLIVIFVGLIWIIPADKILYTRKVPTETSFYLAMILMLFTYGGWNNLAYVAAEIRNPEKNIFRALVLGTVAVTIIYILINMAFINALGYRGMVASTSVAADVMQLKLGDLGGAIISLLICITCLGNISGMIFTGARIYYAVGKNDRSYSWLGEWNSSHDTPLRALVIQAAVTLFLVIGMGFYEDSFKRLVVFSAPLHWFFLLLVSISLFILRIRENGVKRIYRVQLYPLIPGMFCLTNLFMFYASVIYAYEHRHLEIYWIIPVLLLGLLLSNGKPHKTVND
jgi:amino acid transporter